MRAIGTRFRRPPSGGRGAVSVPVTRRGSPTGWPCASSTVTCSASAKSPKRRVTVAMCSSLISRRFEPRLFLIFCQKPLASISCTKPRRSSGLRLETIHT